MASDIMALHYRRSSIENLAAEPSLKSAAAVRVDSGDPSQRTASDSFIVTVDNVAPTITLGGAAAAQVGTPYTLNLGAITDPGLDSVTSLIVHWGDGSTQTLATGGGIAQTYASTGRKTISVDLVDEDGSFISAGTFSVKVSPGKATTASAVGSGFDRSGVVVDPTPATGMHGGWIEFVSFTDLAAGDAFRLSGDDRAATAEGLEPMIDPVQFDPLPIVGIPTEESLAAGIFVY